MFFAGLQVECFFKNKTTEELELTAKQYSMNQCDKRWITFYQIENLVPYFDRADNSKEYTEIVSGGHNYIANINVEALRNAVDMHISWDTTIWRNDN